MLGGADNPNGELPSYITGADIGGLTAMGGILSLNDWAVIIGILCTVGTFGINWYYKRKEREDRLNGNVTGTTK
ncbi:TPA: phage holin family protein [Escherichia coli]|nr:phage holin family protein [Escherichia coli]